MRGGFRSHARLPRVGPGFAAATAGLLLVLSASPSAHRLDEYLQAARVALAHTRVELEIDLTPGAIDQTAGRLQIHASIEAVSRRGGDGGRQLIPTLEVFDNETGKTRVVVCACDGSV